VLAHLSERARVAIIGSGIAGLSTAHFLAPRYTVTLFEANDYLGGHTNTVDIDVDGTSFAVDTGFLVFNNRTYPNLLNLLDELSIPSYPSQMSFSVSLDRGRDEWAGKNLQSVFAQPKQIVSVAHWHMLKQIFRLHREAESYLHELAHTPMILSALLDKYGYGRAIRERYLIPMAASIWSCSRKDVLGFPAASFLRFCTNHGLLQITGRPQWFTVPGGARQYVQAIVKSIPDVRLSCPVRQLRRLNNHVEVVTDQSTERFDAVVLATHAPQSLQMLAEPSEAERAVLSAFRFQPNHAILHRDVGFLPKRQALWSAWNFISSQHDHDIAQPISVTYLINQLQPLPVNQPIMVTLNPDRTPQGVFKAFSYQHPVFDQAAIHAQQRLSMLQGQRNTWFAGAWTGYGFHEDGLKSALRVVSDFGCAPKWACL